MQGLLLWALHSISLPMGALGVKGALGLGHCGNGERMLALGRAATLPCGVQSCPTFKDTVVQLRGRPVPVILIDAKKVSEEGLCRLSSRPHPAGSLSNLNVS